MNQNRTFITRILCFHESKWEQNHRAPGIYTDNHYTKVYEDDIKLKTQSKQKTQRTQEDRTLVFQRNRYKMQTNPFEENIDHMRIMQRYNFVAPISVAEDALPFSQYCMKSFRKIPWLTRKFILITASLEIDVSLKMCLEYGLINLGFLVAGLS